MSFTGAFIIPKGNYHGTNYLYFGIEKNTKEVSAFGGKRDKKESIQKCALRELREESHGVFAKDSTIKKCLANQAKYQVHKVDTRNTCTTYFVTVKPKGNPMDKFDKLNSQKGLKHHQKEMVKIIAIKAEDVIRQVNNTPRGAPMTLNGYPVRSLLNSVLREGVQKGYI